MTDATAVHPTHLSILGARLIDPASGFDQISDLHLADGKLLAVGAPPADFHPEQRIEASGLLAIPGLVDLCARLRQPGLEQKATIRSETRAAAAAGITTLCCPPDTQPVVDTPAVAQLIRQTAEAAGFARVLPAGSLTQQLAGEQISEMAALQRAGCPVLSHADRPIASARVQRRALEYAATFGLTCFLHPANASLAEGGLVHEGRLSTRLGLPGIPEAAETVAVARDLALAEQTGARIHFRGLSSARATEMLAEARARGIQVTADVSAHQLFLTEEAIATFDANALVRPPLRTETDRQALRAAVAAGVISAICSDHQPHEADAKLAPFPQAAPGISTLETLLPLTLRLTDEGLLPLPAALACVTCHAADILGWPGGRLQLGAPADLCLLDPNVITTLDAEQMLSQGKHSPFLGQPMRGQVRQTFLGGCLVFDRKPQTP
ncbi:dihydroorotase [Rhabdochromatium marinum]|uniref:dihydroorotase n=1 Tax=Rhabdochromatium marinum TaxID=48729 RepID=UPI001904F199|nr:dihydroorotase [Rhabdochromatium marinum]MBK1649429.1 dihydroorotase [Rhabdochromatium marinum]